MSTTDRPFLLFLLLLLLLFSPPAASTAAASERAAEAGRHRSASGKDSSSGVTMPISPASRRALLFAGAVARQHRTGSSWRRDASRRPLPVARVLAFASGRNCPRPCIGFGPRRLPNDMRNANLPTSRIGSSGFSSSSSCTSTTTALAMAPRWVAGDVVAVDVGGRGGSRACPGKILRHRGGGWYRVQLLDEGWSSNATNTTRVVNARSSQLTGSIGRGFLTSTEASADSQEAGTETAQLSPPPSPVVVDLDAAVDASQQEQGHRHHQQTLLLSAHRSASRWITFTDLHCSPSTLGTCLEVLRKVHSEALRMSSSSSSSGGVNSTCGVLFLGDFWHHRGTLRVDCLNAVLDELRTWRVPLIMIPGNHDQVTLGGRQHGLTPLRDAYRIGACGGITSSSEAAAATVPGPLVFTNPTKFLGALFVPYIRDSATLESVLASDAAVSAAAVLCHADVTGAYMNDLVVSQGGVPPGMFPPGVPIYSGHFHKPHVVERGGRVVEYLGSPYQVSLSEAQQQKSLAVFDPGQGWKVVDRIPIDVGKRHFRASTLVEFLKLRPVGAEEGTAGGSPASKGGQEPAATDQDNERLQASLVGIRPGDRVVLSMLKAELDRYGNDLDLHTRTLRKAGAAVEIREVRPDVAVEPMGGGRQEEATASGGGDLEDLTPESVWASYLQEEVRRRARTSKSADALLAAGLKILEEVEAGNEDFQPLVGRNATTELALQSVAVEGFGPFRDRVEYPLLDRGLVLLRGVNLDGGSDSNGSGKSSLAVAILWCLTGSMDVRPVQDSRVADVVNDDSKVARVTVRGQLNGIDFSISRSKTATKTGLVFLLGDDDLTCQSAKETQVLVDEKLGISHDVIARTMFHGQHSMNELLESTDTQLKEILSLAVPLCIWQDSLATVRKRGRNATKQADALSGMLAVREGDVEKIQSRIEIGMDKLAQKEADFKEKKAAFLEERGGHSEEDTSAAFENLETFMSAAAEMIRDLEKVRLSSEESHKTEIEQLQKLFEAEDIALDAVEEEYHLLHRERETVLAQLESAERNKRLLERNWELDLSAGDVPEFLTLPESCPTCHQPLTGEGEDLSHVSLRESVHKEAKASVQEVEKAKSALNAVEQAISLASSRKLEAQTSVSEARDRIDLANTQWQRDLEQINKDIHDARFAYEKASKDFISEAKQQQSERLKEPDASIEMERQSLRAARAAIDAMENELAEYEATVRDLRIKVDEQTETATLMKDLSDAFGQRGVQTFVLQNAVYSLEAQTQVYLDDLSDGVQRLELSLGDDDRILRRALVREVDGSFRHRPLASLSGGQWRRCALALNLGFANLLCRRGKLRPSLCILDEPLTHLDRLGRSDAGRVLRGLVRSGDRDKGTGIKDGGGSSPSSSLAAFSTVLLILQDLAAEELEEAFDCMDEVVKEGGTSSVRVDGMVSRRR